MCGWSRSDGQQAGVKCLDLLQREPSPLLHQVDEAEVARAEHDHVLVGDVVLRALLRLLATRLGERMPDHRVLLVAALDGRDAAVVEIALDELLEAVAVALLERCALCLSVIGQDDDLVRTRGVRGAHARCGRTAGRACEAPPACRHVRGRSGERPRHSSKTSHTPRGAPSSCPSARRRRSGRGRSRTSWRAGEDRCRRDRRAGGRPVVLARRDAVTSRNTSQKNSTSERITLKPLAKNAR